jgi:asparagine synthase (glutamine-hydrolysing)
MCGLAGFWNRSPDRPPQDLRATARRMADTLRHRGPNDAGSWDDAAAGYAVGFRRLSIIDLSPHGHQPMASDDGRLVLAFNGEIYNHADVRAELGEGHSYRGHSDTEVMLRAFERWGPDGAVRRFVGMFAFALWDRKERVLTLGRDRLGEKPLYYGRFGDTFLFGSELKALRAHADFRGEIDRDALAEFMRLGYIPAPQSIYRGVFKLPPGTLLTLSADAPAAKPVPYWSARTAILDGLANPSILPNEEAVERLDAELRRTVREQMVADVPLGAFLSGGTDSSTVVGVMQSLSPRPVKTFTIGFREAEYDEAAHARAVAQHLGTEHTELYVTAAEARALVPDLPRMWDEPFGDPSQVPTYLVSRLAAQHVTVSLSGDGGDELFAGYRWYHRSNRLWNRLRWTPPVARHAVAAALTRVPARSWDRVLRRLTPMVPAGMRRDWTGDRVHKFADLIGGVRNVEQVYDSLTSTRWAVRGGVVLGAGEAADRRESDVPDSIHRLMLRDLVGYLPDNILAKVDRASMAASLESRAPLLDHRIAEFACRVPLAQKVRDGRGKWLLRQVLHRYVPESLVGRPKMGFEVPTDHWLRGPLREWASDLLSPARLRRDGYLDAGLIRRKLNEHVSGERNWRHHLWRAVMFQTWLDAQCSSPPLPPAQREEG